MKKLFTMALTLALTLGLASVSLANTISVDFLHGGEVDWDTPNNNDLSQVAVSFEMPFEEFKFGASLSSGIIKDYEGQYYDEDIDTASILLKGGYALVNNDDFRLDLTGGFYDRAINWNENQVGNPYVETESFYSLTLGVDAKIKFSNKAWLDLSYAFGIDPQCDEDYNHDNNYDPHDIETYDLDSISLFNCKFNFLFNPHFGGSVGYNSEISEEGNHTITFSGFTSGIFVRF